MYVRSVAELFASVVLVVLLVVLVLFVMFVGCGVYLLCNVCVAVIMVMSWCLWLPSVLFFASLYDSVVLVGLLVVFMLFPMYDYFSVYLLWHVCVVVILVMSLRL